MRWHPLHTNSILRSVQCCMRNPVIAIQIEVSPSSFRRPCYLRVIISNNLVSALPVLRGSGEGSSLTNILVPAQDVSPCLAQFRTTLNRRFSAHRIIMLSFCQTPSVQIERGPPILARAGASLEDEAKPERILFAMTTSVNIRSPTTTSSSSGIGTRRDEK